MDDIFKSKQDRSRDTAIPQNRDEKTAQSDQKPLLKVLIAAGLGSRREMAKAIQDKRITINGNTVEGFSHPVDPESDTILFDGVPVSGKTEPDLILMLNKPAGIISTTRDERGRHTVIDILPKKYRSLRLYPVGRLDKGSTGLLLLTNNGDLTYRLTHPRFENAKEYLVQVNGRLTQYEKNKIEKGVLLDDGMTYPAVLKEYLAHPPFNYSITIHEGKKRQIRRMFESLGFHVLALKRIRMGAIHLGNLEEGKVRELSVNEKTSLLTELSIAK
jgi:23S rRNA pseudouridine2605 synthase